MNNKHDLVFHGKCPANNGNDDYLGKTGRRISERIMNHNGRDVNSHLFKHRIENKQQCLQNKDYYCEQLFSEKYSRKKDFCSILDQRSNTDPLHKK